MACNLHIIYKKIVAEIVFCFKLYPHIGLAVKIAQIQIYATRGCNSFKAPLIGGAGQKGKGEI
jgi:hypothetical protein